MNKMLLSLLLAVVIVLSGCSLLERVAPSQIDANGNVIPGTHDVSQPIHDTARTIPYAEPLLGVLLLAWNFSEKYRANKLNKGLKATVMAIENAGKDPDIAEAISKLKDQLSHAHDVAGVQPEIRDILAKI
jgi:hypothetical protein